jgi:tetratricopeptide (TPR) repeat protein
MTDPAASSELSQQYYREGFELLKLEHFVESLEKLGKSAELRNKTTPDMYRNQGWCLFRLAEQDAFVLEWKSAEEKFQQAKRFYERALAGFLQMKQQDQSESFSQRLKLRMSDCRRRIAQIGGYLEFFTRRKAWVAVNGDISVKESSIAIEAKRTSDRLVGQSMEQVKRVQDAMNSLMGRFLKEPTPNKAAAEEPSETSEEADKSVGATESQRV